jgi:hypothetical protein
MYVENETKGIVLNGNLYLSLSRNSGVPEKKILIETYSWF